MEDIILKYKKQKRIKNISIVLTSLCLALALNIYVTKSDLSFDYLKWSVLQSWNTVEKKSDIYMEKVKNAAQDIVALKTSHDMINVRSISFSVAYNYENVDISSKFSSISWAEILNLSNTSWFNTILINFKTPTTIKSWDTILNLVVAKKQNQKESINLVNSNFIDSEEKVYMLSNSWFDF